MNDRSSVWRVERHVIEEWAMDKDCHDFFFFLVFDVYIS